MDMLTSTVILREFTHAVKSLLLIVPAGHLMQFGEPELFVNDPTAQGMHPVPSEKYPGEQGPHTSETFHEGVNS